MLLCITYDHTHLEVDLHPAKTMQYNAPRDHSTGYDLWKQNTNTLSICGHYNSGNAGKDYHHLTCDLIETFQDHSPQDQVVETPTSKSQVIDDALVSDLV